MIWETSCSFINVKEYANLEREPKIEGKQMIMILSPKQEKERRVRMPKMTHGELPKIFTTGSGKIKKNSAYKSHILEKKSAKRKRNLATRSCKSRDTRREENVG